MTKPNHAGSTAASERLRSSVADDLPVQPSGLPSPSGSDALRSDNGEPTAASEPIPTGHLPAASPLRNRRPAGARWQTAAHPIWIPLAVLALIVLAIAAGLGRASGRGSQGAGDRAVPAIAPAEKTKEGAR
jgi:hypothetical protein